MPRRAASGHMPATQLSKFAAASRIALAVIRGWPEAPSSPLQAGAPPGPGCWGCWALLPGLNRLLREVETPPYGATAAAGESSMVASASAPVRAIVDVICRFIALNPSTHYPVFKRTRIGFQ